MENRKIAGRDSLKHFEASIFRSLRGDPRTFAVNPRHGDHVFAGDGGQPGVTYMMPTHGYGPFRRMLLGSVTAKAFHMRDARCGQVRIWTSQSIRLTGLRSGGFCVQSL